MVLDWTTVVAGLAYLAVILLLVGMMYAVFSDLGGKGKE